MKTHLLPKSLAAASTVANKQAPPIALTKYLVLCLTALLSSMALGAGQNQSTGIFDYADTYFYPVNNNDQIPWGIVTALAQDHEGYVWVGTQRGVMRFDGYKFQHYEPKPGQKGQLFYPWIETIKEVNPGEIWLGTKKGLSIHNADTGQFNNYESLLGSDGNISITRVDEIHTNERGAWLVSEKRIVLMNPKTLSAQLIGRPEHKGNAVDIHSMQLHGSDKIWLGTEAGLYIYDANKNSFNHVDPELKDRVNQVKLDNTGKLWVSTLNMGLRVIDKHSMNDSRDMRSELIESGGFRGIAPISDNEIWAMKIRNGIYVVDTASKTVRKRLEPEPLIDHSLISLDIRTILKDKSGIIWVGQWGDGILLHDMNNQYIKPLSVRSLGKMQSAHFHIDEIQTTKNFGIWLLGSNKVISLDPKDSFAIKHWPSINQFLKKSGDTTLYTMTNQVLNDGTEILYFLTGNSVLFSFDPIRNKITTMPNQSELNCFESPGMQLDDLARLWISCRYPSKLMRYDTLKPALSQIASTRDKEVGLINNIQAGPQGNLWLATSSGLFTIAINGHEEVKPIEIKQFDGQQVISVLFDMGGNLWVDSYNGLFRGNKNSGNWEFRSISDAIGAKKTQLFGNMLLNKKDWIWGDEGALDTQTLEFHPLRKGEGFNTGPNWIGSYQKLSDGTLLFGTDNQLIVMRSEHYHAWNYSAPLVISSVFLDNQALPAVPKTLDLSIANKSFSADIALLDYYNPNSSTYAYKLEGYDEDWIHTNADNRRIRYTNLSAGDYTLRIKAANTSKIPAEAEITLPIHKAAAVHETIAFRMLVASLLLFGIWGLHQLKLQQYKEKMLNRTT